MYIELSSKLDLIGLTLIALHLQGLIFKGVFHFGQSTLLEVVYSHLTVVTGK